jgi:hypothetical protein
MSNRSFNLALAAFTPPSHGRRSAYAAGRRR